jgi:hypothetical protein
MIVIELACLWGRTGEFVVKEVSIVAYSDHGHGCGSRSTFTYTFMPPYSQDELSEQVKRTNNWVTGKMHSISWNDGSTKYSKLSEVLKYAVSCHENSTIYTKGHEKAVLLTQLIGKPVLDLITLGCPKPETLPDPKMTRTICEFPHKFSQCTLFNCFKYEAWLSRPGIEPEMYIPPLHK